MRIAVTRPVSPSLGDCELTHLARGPIDVARAVEQHAEYERLLASLGATIVRAPGAPDHPDAVFIEDTAIVLDEVAVVARPGAPSRRGETGAVAALLAEYRTVVCMEPPATLDGGDVMLVGWTLYVGRSGRTNDYGIAQLESLVAPFGYHVVPVDFAGCLHLKSAVTAVGDRLLLINPEWISASAFPGCSVLCIDPREPYAANALRFGRSLVYPSQYPFTLDLLTKRGLRVATVDCSELAKAEGAVTCCSLVFEHSLEDHPKLRDRAAESCKHARAGRTVRFEDLKE
jgi:dimethylargininase